MDVALILLIGGAVVVTWIFIWSRQRPDLDHINEMEQVMQEVPIAANGDAVLVSREHGQLLYINAPAREWLGMNGGEPHLEHIARLAQPSDNFLSLFAGESQASFQLGKRWVEASSHRIPTGTENRTVIVMRELTGSSNGSAQTLDMSQAMGVINQIGETIDVSIGVEQTLQTLLMIISQAIKFDAGEINLLDRDGQTLNPRGWVGDASYLVSLAEHGGMYLMDEGITGWIAQHRKPLLLANNDEMAAVHPKIPDLPYNSVIGIPLILGERLIGTLELAGSHDDQFDKRHLALLQAIGNPVSVTIYNAELYANQIKRIEDIASLQQVINQSGDRLADDTTQIYDSLTERVAFLAQADMCGVFVYDETRQTLEPQVPFHNLPEAVVRRLTIALPPDSPQRDIFNNQPYWVSNDVLEEPLVEALGFKDMFSVSGIRNTAWMPLQISQRRIGMLMVNNHHDGGFTPRDIQNLLTLASQAAIVVENIRLYNREQRMDAELAGLQEMTYAVGALSHETDFYAEMTERIARLMGVKMVGIMLFNEGTRKLTPSLPFYGVADDKLDNYIIEIKSGSIFEELWLEEDYWYTNDVDTNAVVFEAGLNDLAQEIGVMRTMIAVLSAGGRRLGVVQISNKLDDSEFDDGDGRLLTIFATQAATIIENTRLFNEIQRTSERAQALRRIAEIAGSIVTSEDNLEELLGAVAQLTESPVVFISVLDQTGSLITYPRWTYGAKLEEPMVQDIYQPNFEHSVVMSRQTFLSNDVMNDNRIIDSYRQIASRMNLESALLVPLVVGDRSLGELGVCNRPDAVYDSEDIELLTSIATQITAAVDRMLVYEATGQNLNRRLDELDAVSRVSNELTLTLDFEQVLNVIRKESLRATGAQGCTVALLVPSSEWVNADVPELDSRQGNERNMPVLADIELEAISRGADSIVIANYENYDMNPSPAEAQSAVAAAILYLDQVIGVIHLYHDQPNRFDSRAAAFLMTLATKAALGYGNMVRFQEQMVRNDRLRHRVEQLNRIFELGHMLHSNTEPHDILEAVAYSIQQGVGYDSILMLLVDEDKNLLRREAHAGLPLDFSAKTKDKTISMDRLHELLKDDYNLELSESYFFPFESFKDWYHEDMSVLSMSYDGKRTIEYSGNRSWRDGDILAVTLNDSVGKILGLIVLDRPFNNLRPDRTTIEVLEIFAHQAATTLENTRLYLTSVRSAEQEARLNELFEAMSDTLDVESIAEQVARGALRLFPFNRVNVALLGSDNKGFDILRATINENDVVEVGRDRRTDLSHTVLGRAFETREDHIYQGDDPEAVAYEDIKIWHDKGERVGWVLPLVNGGENLGAVHFGSDTLTEDRFTEYRQLVRRMTQLFASTVQNARLLDQAVNLQILNESVVESIQQGIVVLDNSGRVISINGFMRERYDWTDEAIGKDLFAYRPDIAELLKHELRQVLNTGVPQERINQNTEETGGHLVVRNFYVYPLRTEDSVRGAVLLVEDVTDRALLEQAMEARANQLAALTEVSSRITSSLERDEVISLALEEMGWIITYDTMTLWRRNGSYMVLEGSAGVDAITAEDEVRIRISDYDAVKQIVDTQRVVALSVDVTPAIDLPGSESGRSWLGVPLVSQGHVVGMLVMTKVDPHAYDGKSDQNIAFAFASQVAIALANAELFEQTFDRTNELGILLEASQATSLTQDLDVVFRIVVELMFSALEMDQVAIMLWNDIDNTVDVRIDMVQAGGDESRAREVGTRFDLSKYKAKLHALREREVVVILHTDDQEHQNPEAEPYPYPLELEELRENDDAARLLVPLVVREESIGLVQLEQHTIDDRVMTQQKLRLAQALGAQVAIAIANARLTTEMSSMLAESVVINELSQSVSSTFNIDEMITTVRDQIPKITGAEQMILALYDEETDEITYPLAVRGGEEYHREPRKLGHDEVSFIIRQNKMLTIGADYFKPEDLRKSLGISESEGGYRSYMGVPMAAEDRVYGVLALMDSQRTRAFSFNDQRILEIVGSQLGVVIQNARLFRQVTSFADELEKQVEERTLELEEERDRIDTLYQITSELSRTLDMDRLQKNALGMMVKAVGAEDGAIMGLDPLSDMLYTQASLNPASLQPDDFGNLTIHPAEPLGNWLIQNLPDVRVDDLHDFEHWDKTRPGAEHWRSALAVVLESNENDPQGVMILLSSKVNAFAEQQLRLLVAAANQVAASINNADLYNLIRDQAERLGTLLRAEQEEAEKNSAILESIADGVVLSDADGRVILFNSAAEHILQLSREQVLGQPLDKFTGLYGTGALTWARAIEEQMENPDAGPVTGFMDERLTLGKRIVNAQLSPVYSGDQFLGMVSVFRDITRDVEVDRMKSEFVSNVSHELRTPLTPIKGFTELLLMGAAGEISDNQHRTLSMIKENVDRLTVLVEDVLDISKIDSGREKLKVEDLVIKDVIDSMLISRQERTQNQRKNIKVTVDIDDDVPEIQADHDKLNRIVANIVDNAFNYTPENGSIDIGVGLRHDGKHILISVRDSGVGIPEEFREDVWKRFSRFEEHALKLDVAGTGLGLSIVREMVELHGGDVWFESEVGEGTTFFISMPVSQPEYLTQLAQAGTDTRTSAEE